MNNNQRKLFLIPATLGDTAIAQVIPTYNLEIINNLSSFAVEDERTARRFLIRCGYKNNINNVRFYLLNEHSQERDVPAILTESYPHDLGLMSEAGVPGVADPGALLVREAHSSHIKVVPLAGPSSLILALMASGLNGQQFAFNGYLPVKGPERAARIKFLEKRSEAEHQSQMFIEAPYRNNQLIESLMINLKPVTRLCIAANLTLPDEWIRTKTIYEWKQLQPPDLNKKPAVFIFQS
jgi:16S rRNA (cytidine1402-2'-O)-methyltransferase